MSEIGTPIDSEKIVFADEEEESLDSVPPWKVLIVDDEPQIHDITRLALDDYQFDDRPLEFISAYSGREARDIMTDSNDIALVLLDVVMESDHAGLDTVRFIREELKEFLVRIILRTGQPGQAPETTVIRDYDINDYKEKTELTAQKLFTAVTTALRTYRDILALEQSRQGLQKIVEAAANLYQQRSMEQFTAGVLQQMAALFHYDDDALYAECSGFAAESSGQSYKVLAGTGEFSSSHGMLLQDVLTEELYLEIVHQTSATQSRFGKSHYVRRFESKDGVERLLYIRNSKPLTELDKQLLEVFETNISTAFDNIRLNHEIVDTQREVILTLGQVVETRSKDTANHVRRVAKMCRILATKCGVDAEDAVFIEIASAMHDIGKIGIPDTILNKQGKYTAEEHDQMKEHVHVGHEILKSSNKEVMKIADIIALQHHERWDGKGYPYGLEGEEIHLYGRIAALVDVFDALSHSRVYKEAWELDAIVELFKAQRDKHFDARIVDKFLENLDEFVKVNEELPD